MEQVKLTPRVGDRVLVKYLGVTRSGEVIERGEFAVGQEATVLLDFNPYGHYYFQPEDLTVVDREPVEWPEGWSKHDDTLVLHEASDIAFDKLDLTWVLESGPDMLARWDELMGEQ